MRKVCVDRVLPQDNMRALRFLGASRLVAPRNKSWINGSTLKVKLLRDVPPTILSLIKKETDWWQECCNIKFEFVTEGKADIRITFDQNDGAWSYIGTDCANIAQDQPTMNLGFLDPGTIAHEFGHALGFGHEHQNPAGGIEWNVPEVIKDLSGSPNFWDRATIQHNVLDKYAFDQVKSSQFDADSIMCYFFPKEWTLNNVETKQNETLSPMDKHFAGSAQMYPKPVVPVEPPAPPVVVDPPIVPVLPNAKRLQPNYIRRTQASIRKPGEEDLFVFTVPVTGEGTYIIDTRGKTNVAMRLFGPNSITAKIAEDNDSGLDCNALIRADLSAGEYYVQIRHEDVSVGTGKYNIKVSHKPAGC